ncbi:sugar ABC transporter substrate-binding protein [Subtercola frigoramans]|uniref:ABC-type sugar transport system substrate-binding protein n=1 Tax=Subtercola frigoramans TaxID=120298 RepID=A0ABS2L764_9MICO|nr:sugar ABC transporter substrate-binding protein [Subtercola frigoramans]MBM7472907.1 ABC-type sugar transport system substrate-binding protein [Subtercola frigoramans]
MFRTNRRLQVGSLAAIFAASALVLSGCASGATPSSGATTIAYSVESLDEGQSNVVSQMKLRVNELNKAGANITLDVFGADNKVDRQNNDIESIVTRKTQALLLTAVDPAGSLSAAQAAHDAGVKVIDVRGTLGKDKIDAVYDGLNEELIGQVLEDHTRQYLKDNPTAVLKFGLIKGGETFTSTHVRVEGIKKLAAEMPDRVQILAEDYGDWTTDKAASLMEDWSVRYPDMNALATSSDEMTLGTVNVLKSKGNLDKFFIVSVNGSDNGLKMLDAKEINATVGIDFGEYGAGLIDAAIAAIKGEVKDGQAYTTGADKVTVLVDSSNLADFEAKKKAEDAAAAALK